MADPPPFPTVRISDLPAAPQANTTDQFHVNQDGTSRRLTVGQVVALVPPGQPGEPGKPGTPGEPGPPGPSTGLASGDLVGSYPAPKIKNDVALMGLPTAIPPPPNDNSARIATTAWVNAAIYNVTDAPDDGKLYARKGRGWVEFIPGVPEAPVDGKAYNRQDAAWVEFIPGVTEAPSDGQAYARQNAAWVRNLGDSVTISAGAVTGTPILTTQTPFTLNPPNPNVGGYWNQATQEFKPPPGVYQINGTLSCTSTNNTANAALLMMINGVEFARATGGAAQANIMSCTLALAVVTTANEVITFKMMSNRADMTVRTPGSGLSIIGRVSL